MTNIHHNNYKILYAQVLEELAEAKRTISDNNEYYGEQMMSLSAEIALLKQKLKRKSLQ